MKEKIILMPKVELHLHLDGSVPIPLLEKLSGKSEEEIKKEVIGEASSNLEDYLKCFELPIDCLQRVESLELASYELGKRLEKENVIYAEIRFAPISHTKKGLPLEMVVESVLKGLQRVRVKTNLILCLRRGATYEENMRVVQLANKYLGKGVVAVDLVGDEQNFPFKEYEYFFRVCKYADIPVTIHAGEVVSRDIKDVLLYTKRIGHGIKIYDNEELIQKVIDNDTLLEICPKSNIDTKNVSNYLAHPIKYLYDKGVSLCINTDNMTVSNITLEEEYANLYDTFKFTLDDFKKMNLCAIDRAFLSEKEKEALKKIINDYY